jgi:hypothetical protein
LFFVINLLYRFKKLINLFLKYSICFKKVPIRVGEFAVDLQIRLDASNPPKIAEDAQPLLQAD